MLNEKDADHNTRVTDFGSFLLAHLLMGGCLTKRGGGGGALAEKIPDFSLSLSLPHFLLFHSSIC